MIIIVFLIITLPYFELKSRWKRKSIDIIIEKTVERNDLEIYKIRNIVSEKIDRTE